MILYYYGMEKWSEQVGGNKERRFEVFFTILCLETRVDIPTVL